MKLHDLRPAEGSRTARTRVGRGIAAGQGKTAGRGTKGQKARAGGSIPPWFEGGQTPLHMRIPKLRGFKNRFRIEYEVVNVGAIAAAVERGALELPAPAKGKSKGADQITVNQDLLRAVGLVRSMNKPLKILGNGELSVPLFVVADAFTASARTKIEAAGGTVNVLEIPGRPTKAIGLEVETPADEAPADEAKAETKSKKTAAKAAATEPVDVAEPVAEVTESDDASRTRRRGTEASADEASADGGHRGLRTPTRTPDRSCSNPC